MLPKDFHPKMFFKALKEIDSAIPPSLTPAMARASIILLTSAICLLFFHIGLSDEFRILYFPRAEYVGIIPTPGLIHSTTELRLPDLPNYSWWLLCHIVCLGLIPLFVIKLVFKESVRDYGVQLGDTLAHWRGYLLLLLPLLALTVAASFSSDFIYQYPLYPNAARSWADFLIWESMYICQFILVEFFFRGFMIQTLSRHFGSLSIWIMVVPYMMLHLPKPGLEAAGSIFFGFFLGMLALRSRSIWGGVAIHTTMALGMDIAALTHKNAFPTQWLPT